MIHSNQVKTASSFKLVLPETDESSRPSCREQPFRVKLAKKKRLCKVQMLQYVNGQRPGASSFRSCVVMNGTERKNKSNNFIVSSTFFLNVVLIVALSYT